MSRDKKIMLISLAAAFILFVIAVGAWWYLFFGRANAPLSRVNVSIQSSSSSIAATSGVITAAASGVPAMASSSTSATDTDISIANPPLSAESLSIDSATFNVEIASTVIEQTRGLSYRPSLGENDGMLFLFGAGTIQTFWMKDMNFPLDMIWISGSTVDGFEQNVPAPAPGTQIWALPIYASPDHTDKVLEVNAGTVAKYNIKVGDTVTIGPIE